MILSEYDFSATITKVQIKWGRMMKNLCIKNNNTTMSLRPMIPIKVKKYQINLATYVMFNVLSNNVLMKAKNLKKCLRDL